MGKSDIRNLHFTDVLVGEVSHLVVELRNLTFLVRVERVGITVMLILNSMHLYELRLGFATVFSFFEHVCLIPLVSLFLVRLSFAGQRLDLFVILLDEVLLLLVTSPLPVKLH